MLYTPPSALWSTPKTNPRSWWTTSSGATSWAWGSATLLSTSSTACTYPHPSRGRHRRRPAGNLFDAVVLKPYDLFLATRGIRGAHSSKVSLRPTPADYEGDVRLYDVGRVLSRVFLLNIWDKLRFFSFFFCCSQLVASIAFFFFF